jgi:hypothetical protein
LLFDVDDPVLARPAASVPAPVVTAAEQDLTPVAGVALWGPLLDRLNVVAEADRRGLRPIGPGGYTGGQCYRTLTEVLLAGGDFLSDRELIADPGTGTLRGDNSLPSVPTLWRFLAGADLGRVAKAAAVNRVMLRRAWAAGAAPDGDRVTVDPAGCRDRYRLWLRVDSAGYQRPVIEAAERHDADFSVTAKQYRPVAALICALAVSPDTVWAPALGAETEKGSQIAETTANLLGRTLRLIVRRQPKQPGEQLALDDLDGWRLHAIITNVDGDRMSAAEVEAHHRLRGGIPEDTIRALKNDFGMTHAPVQSFFGNWLYWQATALAHNVALWLRTLALPRAFRRARGKRLRLAFLNVAARLIRHGRQLHLRFTASYPHLQAFLAALNRIRALPAFG